MPRKRVIPKHVTPVIDRHGKERFRFRRQGFSCYLPHPGAPDFKERYDLAMQSVGTIKPRAKPGTIGELVPNFYGSMAFNKGGAGWQNTVRQILEPFREEFADDRVADFEAKDIEVIITRKQVQTIVNGRKVGGTAAALRLYEQLIRLFDRAIFLKMITDNPVRGMQVKPSHEVTGFYPWEEADIVQFRKHWALGTKPRLAMELMLWSGTRRGDAHRIGPKNLATGKLVFKAAKNKKDHVLPIAPALQAALDAMPKLGTVALVETGKGQPYTRFGFGNWFKEACVKAGLPKCTTHGLRKALARRSAELSATQQELKALGGWSGDSEVATYTDSANRERLAGGALDAVIAWERTVAIVQPLGAANVQPSDNSQKTATDGLTLAGAGGMALEGDSNDLE